METTVVECEQGVKVSFKTGSTMATFLLTPKEASDLVNKIDKAFGWNPDERRTKTLENK